MPARGYSYTTDRRGVSPETLSVISARNRIFAIPAWEGGNLMHQIGVVASFNPSEGRTIEPVRGIGYGDRVMELVPGLTDPMTISVTRTAQYLSMIMQVFGYKGGVDGICRSLRHHKYPFDIRQELIIGAMTTNQADVAVGAIQSESSGGVPDVLDDTPTGVSPANSAATGDIAASPSGENIKLKALLTIYEACWMSDWSIAFASDTALVQEDVTINVTDILAAENVDASDESPNLFNGNAVSNIIRTAFGSDRRSVTTT